MPAVHGKDLGQLKVELAAVVEGDLAILPHLVAVDPVAVLIRRVVIIIPDLIALGRLHRQLDRAVEVAIGQISVRCAEHRVAVFHRGYAGGLQGIAHLGSSVQWDGAGVGLNAHVLIGGDGHIKGAVVVREGSPPVLGIVPLAVSDSCPPLRRDFHGFGAAVVRVKNLGDGVDVRRCNGRFEGKWLTEEALVGCIVIVGNAVALRGDVSPVKRCSIGEAGIRIGIQPAAAHFHDGSVLQVIDGIGFLAVPGQLRRHQHDFISAACADTVLLRKGQVLVGVAGLLGHAFVPLHAVAHIAQVGARLHGVAHRHQHHILLNVGEGLVGLRPACAVPAALRVQGVIPIEERALSLRRLQRQVRALVHNIDVVEPWLYHSGIVDAAGRTLRFLPVHGQTAGLLHGGNAGGGVDILILAPGVPLVTGTYFDCFTDAAGAHIHICAQRGLFADAAAALVAAADDPVPLILAVYYVIIPTVHNAGIGVDDHPLLHPDDVGGGFLRGKVDVSIGVVVNLVI